MAAPALFPDRQNNVRARSLWEPGTSAEDTFLFICLANLPRLTGHQPPLSLGPLPPSTSLFDCICTNASIFGGREGGRWGAGGRRLLCVMRPADSRWMQRLNGAMHHQRGECGHYLQSLCSSREAACVTPAKVPYYAKFTVPMFS